MALDQATIAHTSFLDCSAEFCEHMDGAAFEVYGDWAMVLTGIPFPSLNFVTPLPTSTTTVGFPDALGRLAGTGIPHSVALRSELDDGLAEIPAGLGYTVFDRVPAMVAGAPALTPWPDELERIEGMDARDAHIEVVMAAFGLPFEEISRMVAAGLVDGGSTDTVVGLADDVPVATALGINVDGVCGVFNVATAEAHRGKGYGAALTSEVVRMGTERGSATPVLQSTAIGFRVYERLGFATVFEYVHWKASD